MKTKGILRQMGFSQEAVRSPEDFYITPDIAIQELLKREKFTGKGWEPACGNGAISKFFLGIRSSDIRQGKDIFGEGGVDFLKTWDVVDFIITNPPFKFVLSFIEHAIECTRKKVAMFARIQLLEGKKRYYFFKQCPPIRIYVFSSRITCAPHPTKKCKIMCFAWFVWEIGYIGKPTLDWILINESSTSPKR